jgi:hypothetical protein
VVNDFRETRNQKLETGLRRLYVDSLQSFLAFLDIEIHFLSFLKAAEAGSLDVALVYKDVLTALPLNKAETFRVVEPLYGTAFHVIASQSIGAADESRTLSTTPELACFFPIQEWTPGRAISVACFHAAIERRVSHPNVLARTLANLPRSSPCLCGKDLRETKNEKRETASPHSAFR